MRRYAFELNGEVCGEMDGCRLDFSPTAEAIELLSYVDLKEVEGFGLWSLFTDVLMDELRHANTCRTEVRSTAGTLADGVWWR